MSEESITIKARNYADIAKLSEPTVAEQFLAEPLAAIVETITGLFAEGPKKFALVGSHIIQAALKGQMLEQWARESKNLRAKGAIADDFEETKYGFQTWAELISIIDEERPDADRLEALKAMFLAVNRVNATDGERIVAYQLWMIAKRLTSGELLLLKAAYENQTSTYQNHVDWGAAMARHLGHDLAQLIFQHDKKLVELGLFTEPQVTYDSTSTLSRLTAIGTRVCTNIQNYELILRSKD